MLLFEILGPIRVSVNHVQVAITARRQQVLLAMLLLQPDRRVGTEQLIDAIWASSPPRDAASQVHGSVYRLRKCLAAAGAPDQIIVTEAGGYRVGVDPERIDLCRFRRVRDEARGLAATSSPDARPRYRTALALWRGPALAGVGSDLVRQAAAALDDERAQAQEECIEIELAIGGGGELVAELTDLVAQHPYREGLHGALMLALYRAGRQAEALASYRHIRNVLDDDLGTEPGLHLQRLHQAILNHEPDLAPPRQATDRSVPPERLTPRELPADAAGFTGRSQALRALNEMLEDGTTTPPSPVIISAIAGTAGVGKTALAVRWSHRVADRFPDGQLYINLRGYAPGPPMRPIDALGALLRSLGTESDQIPTDVARAAGLYRSRLAGHRVLIVLDNARSVDQVRPLLPGWPGCFVVVTSREKLAGLVARDGARRLTLDVLNPDEAYALLARILGTERLQPEPEAALELARLCAYLPLSLRIAAASLVDHPDRTITSYVAEMSAGCRLGALETDDDPESAIRATIDLSYESIPPGARRLFCLLGLIPGHDITAVAAAAMAGTTVDEARQLLNRLSSAHLVEEHVSGRYTFHDLLRLYAKDRAEVDIGTDHRTTAVERLLGWYLITTDAAAKLLYPGTLRLPLPQMDIPAPPIDFDQPAALAWLDAERVNLVAVIEHTAERGPRPLAWLLADRLRAYLWRQGFSAESVAAVEAALRAAEHEGDLRAQAIAHFGLSDPHIVAGRHARAAEHLTTALTHARQANWAVGQAMIVSNLGLVHWSAGDLARAAEYVTQAQALHRQAGSKPGEAASLGNLGIVSRELGDLRQAQRHQIDAIALYRELGSGEGEAQGLANLGEVCHDLGKIELAREHMYSALAAYRSVGDRRGESEVLHLIAAVQRDEGLLDDALDTARVAVRQATEAGDRQVEAQARCTMGSVYLRLGGLNQAVDCYEHAIDIARQTCSRSSEIASLIGLAEARHQLDEPELAVQHIHVALELTRRSGYRVLEGQALTTLARIALHQGRHNDARVSAHRALKNHRATGHSLGVAHTLALLGHIMNATVGPKVAQPYVHEALGLFATIGSPAPDELRQLDGCQPA